MKLIAMFLLISELSIDFSNGMNDVFSCEAQSPCVCLYPNDMALDLTTLLVSPTPANFSTAANTTHVYFYHPCNDAVLNATDPGKAGVLFLFVANANNISAATLNPTSVLDNKVNGTMTLLATSVQYSFEKTLLSLNTAVIKYTNDTLVSVVRLDCVGEGPNQLKIDTSPDIPHYLRLEGPIACPQAVISNKSSPSTGTVLVVIFLTASLIYLVGGCLLKKYLRGAEGLEMIPHEHFWFELPELVKDGWVFAISCGSARPGTYERI